MLIPPLLTLIAGNNAFEHLAKVNLEGNEIEREEEDGTVHT